MTSHEILMLAVDQRPWLTNALYGHTGAATTGERSAIAAGKHAVLDGLLSARERLQGMNENSVAILVDEQLGPGVAERARAAGVTLSMPVERGGLDEYQDEPANLETWLEHHQPDLTKVLVRYNPEDPHGSKERQLVSLGATAAAAQKAGTRFLFELLVPPTVQQREAVDGDLDTYAVERRPSLIQTAMQEIAARMPIDVWKLEHPGRAEDYRTVVDIAAGHNAECILLGAGAPRETVNEWLHLAASSGFAGFAIGRSIWWEPFKDLLAGANTHDQAVRRISEAYLEFVAEFRAHRA